MNELNNKMIDIYKIMKQCEESELASFAYKDSSISIQFNKLAEGATYNTNSERDEIENYVNELQTCNMKFDIDEVAISNTLQDNDLEKDDIITITSPFVGTVEFSNQIKLSNGDIAIKKGDVICSVEAMKIYNDIKSPVTGTIVQLLVEDCNLVEFEQPIVKVRVDKDE